MFIITYEHTRRGWGRGGRGLMATTKVLRKSGRKYMIWSKIYTLFLISKLNLGNDYNLKL